MADLVFGCTGASAERYAATPTLSFAVTITESTGVPVHAIALRCQIRIEPQRRRYSAAEARRLHDLFGDTSRWADTVKPIQLAIVTTMVPAFSALTEIEVQMPCTYDLEVASARYLQALDDGTIPLLLLFSGTVFLAQGNGYSVELVPWSSEASFRMPVSVWQDVVDLHFPGSAWLRCSRETLDALSAFKTERALPTWDATLGRAAGGGRGGQDARRAADHRGGDRAVNFAAARAVADAVMYEGYILYPYRASAAKNQSRWQFGVVMSPGYTAVDPSERSFAQTECVLEHGAQPTVAVVIRFLQVQRRSTRAGPARWDEAVEHEVVIRVDGTRLGGDGHVDRVRDTRRRGTRAVTSSGCGRRWPGPCRCSAPRCPAPGAPPGCGSAWITGARRAPCRAPETRRCRPRWSPRT